ncbi:YdcF family protein [Paenibacillus sp. JX-17]|uniref:YdcF family protein n=1 Tax=Paenibacillus lacisoli TaxID=3064525 RepID=A0ABT9CAK6_9BACL|nr:YdcF family protein [Paenibacillus sp. JX-17]MDO7906300.1 YdcF family protein [Paenibacillus sp. JX-17]
MIVLHLAALTCLVSFLISYRTDPRMLRSGVFLTLGLGLFLLSLGLRSYLDAEGIPQYILTVLLVLLIVIAPFLAIALGIALIQNGRVLISKEGRKLPNLLSLGMGAVIAGLAALYAIGQWNSDTRFYVLLLLLLAGYYGFVLISFLVSCILANSQRPAWNQDFIIVLGSGLIQNRVPPLLAGRLDRAVNWYYRQSRVGAPPRFIVSGGQGSDETLAEGEAMRRYLLGKGIPEASILVEDRSSNTMENLTFSKAMMDQEKGQYKCIYVTSNFHLARAGIYARDAGIPGTGIGSRTALYYLPNAFLREYIAILTLHRWIHLSVTLAVILIMVGLAAGQAVYSSS